MARDIKSILFPNIVWVWTRYERMNAGNNPYPHCLLQLSVLALNLLHSESEPAGKFHRQQTSHTAMKMP